MQLRFLPIRFCASFPPAFGPSYPIIDLLKVQDRNVINESGTGGKGKTFFARKGRFGRERCNLRKLMPCSPEAKKLAHSIVQYKVRSKLAESWPLLIKVLNLKRQNFFCPLNTFQWEERKKAGRMDADFIPSRRELS